jgi:aryl-alcohol dehydrogenase-like predicted oxidoreductase
VEGRRRAAVPVPAPPTRSGQSLYNLLTREIELEVLPAARAYGVGVIPWSPLQGGLLGGALKKEREGRRRQAGRA